MNRANTHKWACVRAVMAVVALVLIPAATHAQQGAPSAASPLGTAQPNDSRPANILFQPPRGGSSSVPAVPAVPAAPAAPLTGTLTGGANESTTKTDPHTVLLKLARALRDVCESPTRALVSAIETPRLAADDAMRAKAETPALPSSTKKQSLSTKPSDFAKSLVDDERARSSVRKDVREAARKEIHDEAVAAATKAKAELEKFDAGVCKTLCSANEQDATVLDVCRFDDSVLASAAVIADWDTIESVARLVQKHVIAIERAADLPSGSLAAMMQKRELSGRVGDFTALAAATTSSAVEGAYGATGLDLAAVSVRLAETGLAALAKVIEDRAKREGLVWFLETMHENLCGEEPDPKKPDPCESPADGTAQQTCQIQAEVRTTWFPATCALASRTSAFLQYGGGGDLLKALRGAIASDLKGWPGAASGLALGAAYWKALYPKDDTGSFMACATPGCRETDPCKVTGKVRRAGAKLVADFIAGANATTALYDLSGEIDAVNRVTVKVEDGERVIFRSDPFQVAACVASIPLVFQDHTERVRDKLKDRFQQSEALLLGALAGTPACFAIVGEGVPRTCKQLGGGQGDCRKQLALGSTGSLERLNTILRWADHVDGPARAVLARWAALADAVKAYRKAVEDWRNAPSKDISVPPPDFSKIGDKETLAAAVQTAEKYLQDSLRVVQKSEQTRVIQATVAMARAAVELGDAIAAAGEGTTNKALYPGFCARKDQGCDALAKAKAGFTEARVVLHAISQDMGIVESAITEDWGAASGRVIASVKAHMEAACKADRPCREIAAKLSRYTGVFVALATETDPDRVAKVLDDSAMPVGGWRRKTVHNSLVVSVGSIPGLAFGGEARWGQYGARSEHGFDASKRPYFVSPTLVMPVGLDVSFGWGGFNTALFVSLLDPAAYLQYDASGGGRLPGAQIVTALSPGLWGRVSLGNSPFGINLYGVFRPQLRAWEPSAGGPAADAFQLGASLSVDVTLWELYAGELRK